MAGKSEGGVWGIEGIGYQQGIAIFSMIEMLTGGEMMYGKGIEYWWVQYQSYNWEDQVDDVICQDVQGNKLYYQCKQDSKNVSVFIKDAYMQYLKDSRGGEIKIRNRYQIASETDAPFYQEIIYYLNKAKDAAVKSDWNTIQDDIFLDYIQKNLYTKGYLKALLQPLRIDMKAVSFIEVVSSKPLSITDVDFIQEKPKERKDVELSELEFLKFLLNIEIKSVDLAEMWRKKYLKNLLDWHYKRKDCDLEKLVTHISGLLSLTSTRKRVGTLVTKEHIQEEIDAIKI